MSAVPWVLAVGMALAILGADDRSALRSTPRRREVAVVSENKLGCPVKGCPWRGRPEDCPFPHYDRDDGDTRIDRLMQERPDGRRRK